MVAIVIQSLFFQDVTLFFLVSGKLNVLQKQVGQVKEVTMNLSTRWIVEK